MVQVPKIRPDWVHVRGSSVNGHVSKAPCTSTVSVPPPTAARSVSTYDFVAWSNDTDSAVSVPVPSTTPLAVIVAVGSSTRPTTKMRCGVRWSRGRDTGAGQQQREHDRHRQQAFHAGGIGASQFPGAAGSSLK